MTAGFRPILYLKQGCPSCFKVRLFLLESGLSHRFEVHEFTPGDANEAAIRGELEPRFEKVTFPTVQTAPGDYLQDSDAIVERYAHESGTDALALPIFQAYANGLLPRLRRLSRENKELKAASAS